MGIKDELKEFRGLRERLEKSIDTAKTRIRHYWLSISKEELKAELREYESSELENLCSDIAAIENEDYEICQAIREVLEERYKDSNGGITQDCTK